ncbi:MAG TPA: transketolase C-terminal domain-containing protein [Candidatus Limnocylindrales bacterium]|nr:transketolase C-terminal domain-containing protein [Candidatus Limnocylindrales bacterium]
MLVEADELEYLAVEEFTRVCAGITDPDERLKAFAGMVRVNTLYMVMRAGSGHVGSSFSAADIVTFLLLEQMHRPFDAGGDVYFSSKGHDVPSLYAALIGLGQLEPDLVHRLRRLGGLPGHPDVRTPHMPFNTGSLGMGISKAKGLVLADRRLGRRRRVFVLTGDGELQEGQNWEALAGAVKHRMSELTVIVDHNKLQSDTWVADVSDLGDLAGKFHSFGWGVLRCDGHDFADLRRVMTQRWRRFAGQPAVIIADTVKGHGCTAFAATSMPAGQWRYMFHSGAPGPEDYRAAHAELIGQVLRHAGLDSLQLSTHVAPKTQAAQGVRLVEVYGRELLELARTDPRVMALDADLVLDTGLIPLAGALGDQFVECGIAEQDMVSMAGGLAAGGLLPFAHSFSCFLHARANEQIYNNATEGRKVVYVGSLAGLLPAGPGHSHQAVRDVSAVAAIPGLVVLEPGNSDQTRRAVRFCQSTTDSVYLRLTSVPVDPAVEAIAAQPLQVGRGHVVRRGDGRITLIGSGPVVLGQALQAAQRLAARGIELTVVGLPWLNRLDPLWLREIAADCDVLIVAENHYRIGGSADLVARTLHELALPRAPRFIGIGIGEVPRCGGADEVLAAHGLDAASLAGLVEQISSLPRSGEQQDADCLQ